MTKEKLWLFGDSYCDLYFRNDLSYKGWPELIREKYDVTNLAKTGSGPDYSMSKLVEMLEKTGPSARKQIHIFFGISDIYRIPLQFCNPQHRADSYESLLKVYMLNRFFPNFYNKESRKESKSLIQRHFTKKQQHFIENMYRENILYSSYKDTELLKIIFFLKGLSEEFKSVYVVSLFQNVPSFISTIKNTENFLFSPTTVQNIFPNNTKWGEDKNNNHLPKEVHQKLVDSFFKWTNERQPFDFKDFL